VVKLGSQSILILRNSKQELKAFHNVCRHRGSLLCTADQGSFARNRIVCPYHAWTYDLEGSLVATPRRKPTPDFDEKKFSLFPVALKTWGGFVFACLSDKPPAFEEPATFRNHRLQDLRTGKRVVADAKANWKLLAENFSECFYCPPVHPELCRIVTAYREAGAWGLRGKEKTAEFRSAARTLTLDGSARVPAFRIVYDWLFEPAHMPQGTDLEHYTALWEITNRQDARNCEWQQQGIQSTKFRHGNYLPQEFDCHRFAEWIRSTLRAAPAGYGDPSPTARNRTRRRRGRARTAPATGATRRSIARPPRRG